MFPVGILVEQRCGVFAQPVECVVEGLRGKEVGSVGSKSIEVCFHILQRGCPARVLETGIEHAGSACLRGECCCKFRAVAI